MTISHEPTWIGAGQKAYRKVKGDVTADVAVIGGGLTGLLTAYLLSKNGKRLAVLEASTLGSGATAYTTAFITQVIDTSLSDLISMFGAKKAQRIWQAGEHAIRIIETIVKREKIECEFQRCSARVYASNEKDYKDLENEHRAARRLGFATYAPFNNPGTSRYKKGMYSSYVFEVRLLKRNICRRRLLGHQPSLPLFRIDHRGTFDRMILGGEGHCSELPQHDEEVRCSAGISCQPFRRTVLSHVQTISETPSPSKLPKTSKASAHERRLVPFRQKKALHCSIVEDLTREEFKRNFAPNGGSPMSIDATKKPPATATNEPEDDLEERIRLRAHEFYEARGREDGHELEDWLRAEEELTAA